MRFNYIEVIYCIYCMKSSVKACRTAFQQSYQIKTGVWSELICSHYNFTTLHLYRPLQTSKFHYYISKLSSPVIIIIVRLGDYYVDVMELNYAIPLCCILQYLPAMLPTGKIILQPVLRIDH